jgi:hypothetical protein
MDEARNRINIVVLDACRDNPLPKGRSVARGLVSMQAPRGTFIGFAAAPGQAAMEGEPGGNGVFTGTLVQQLTVPGLAIEEVFKRTIAGVEERTGGKQVPWMESSLQGDFYFTAPVTAAVTPPSTPATEVVFWESIKGSADPADFVDFLKRYPNSEFASLAQRRLDALKAASKTAALAPSGPTSSPAAPDAATAPVAPASAQEVVRRLQSELKRVRCYTSSVDGVWGAGTAAAVEQFNQRTGKHLDTQIASSNAIAIVRERTDRVCPAPPVKHRAEPAASAETVYQPVQANPPLPNPPSPAPSVPQPGAKCFTFGGKQYCE